MPLLNEAVAFKLGSCGSRSLHPPPVIVGALSRGQHALQHWPGRWRLKDLEQNHDFS
jgi:hypothetical protein